MTEPQGAGFTRVPGWLVRKVSPTAVAVFIYLSEYGTWDPASGRYVNVRPSQITIAKLSRLSRRTVQRAMDELEAAGALERRACSGPTGQEPSSCTLYVGFAAATSTESEPAITPQGCVTNDAPDQIGHPASPMTHPPASPMTQGLTSPGVTHDAPPASPMTHPPASPMTHNPKEPTYHPGTTSSATGDDEDHFQRPADLDLSAPPTRQDPLPPLPGAPTLVGIQALIFDRLKRIKLPAVDQDARDIHHRYVHNPNVKDVSKAIWSLTQEQLRRQWHEVREQRVAAFEEQRAALPDCLHGEPGGNVQHPLTGQPSCVLCQRGLPAEQREQAPPELSRAIAAWANAWTVAFERRPNPLALGRAYRQIVQVLAAGVPADQLEVFAAAAGSRGQEPMAYAAKIDNYMNQGSAQ